MHLCDGARGLDVVEDVQLQGSVLALEDPWLASDALDEEVDCS
jgi:hypothetical protein